MFDMGAKSVVEKLLPIIDNFERGFAGLSEEQMSDPFVSGMDMVYKQLVKALADMGVEPIEAVGKPFDPNLHNAVMHVEDENLGENTVTFSPRSVDVTVLYERYFGGCPNESAFVRHIILLHTPKSPGSADEIFLQRAPENLSYLR